MQLFSGAGTKRRTRFSAPALRVLRRTDVVVWPWTSTRLASLRSTATTRVRRDGILMVTARLMCRPFFSEKGYHICACPAPHGTATQSTRPGPRRICVLRKARTGTKLSPGNNAPAHPARLPPRRRIARTGGPRPADPRNSLGRVVELADTQDLGSCAARLAGSSPASPSLCSQRSVAAKQRAR